MDQTGRLSQVNYPNGQVTNYGYYPNSAATPGNDDQRLSQIQNLTPSSSNLSTFGYGYNAAGIITSWSKQFDAGSALTSNFGYDNADQLIAASVPALSPPNGNQNYSYQYDSAGNRTAEQIDPAVTGSSYNNLNQLVSQAGSGNMVFTGTVQTVNNPITLTLAGQATAVDASGNWRGTAPVNAGANSIPLVATDANGKTTTKTITITVPGGAARIPNFDANGNLTNDGAGKTYGYDAANRLISVTQSGTIIGYTYDGWGHRVQETSNGTVVKQWVWCGGAEPCEERDGSNNVTKRFYPQGEQIAGTNYYFTKDHLWSVREMTDAHGNLVARYDYDPYGRRTLVSGTDLAGFGFTGFYYDQATGLDLTVTRAYASDLGRWTTRDTVGEIGGINLYRYCADDPINHRDPKGQWLIGAIIGAIAGAASGYIGAETQGSSTGAAIFSAVVGGIIGGVVGTFDPTEGVGTLAAVGAISGLVGDELGQVFGQLDNGFNNPCYNPGFDKFNYGELAGSTIGGGIAGGLGAVVGLAALSEGIGEAGQGLLGGYVGFIPSTFGGVIGSLATPDSSSGGK